MRSLVADHVVDAPMAAPRRRLCAVLAADVVGYSRLTEIDEEAIHRALMRLRTTVLEPGVARGGGRIFKHTGDGFLAVFDSAANAVHCALELQAAAAKEAEAENADRRIAFRMAVHLADVILEGDDVYGGGVNVAARLQAYAEPGGVVVSGTVAEQLGDDIGYRVIDLGELQLRNLVRPVHVFAIEVEARRTALVGDSRIDEEPRPSIAVLPFRKRLSDAQEAYFADGIVETIIHALGSLKELFVISRGSTLGYGGAVVDVRQIGRELGVQYVLYGSVYRSGERIRIATELSSTATGTVLRTDRYEGHQSELFALQDEIATRVVKAIAPHVRELELKKAMRKHPQNLTAYDLVLQAIDRLYRMDEDSFARARGLLQQAIAHDPGYAPAYSYIAYWYVFRVGEIGSTDTEGDALAGARYAQAAIERDPDDAQALAIFGHVQSFLMRNYAVGIEYLDRALAAGPNSAIAWTMSSASRGYVGDADRAVADAEQGVRLSPLDAHTFWHEGLLAQAHYVRGDFDEAVAWARRAVGRNPAIRFTTRVLAASLAAIGRTDEAIATGRRLLALQPDFRMSAYALRCPFQRPTLDRWLADLRKAGLPD